MFCHSIQIQFPQKDVLNEYLAKMVKVRESYLDETAMQSIANLLTMASFSVSLTTNCRPDGLTTQKIYNQISTNGISPSMYQSN